MVEIAGELVDRVFASDVVLGPLGLALCVVGVILTVIMGLVVAGLLRIVDLKKEL